MTKLIDLLDQLKHRRTFGFLDDFDWYLSPHRWTSVFSHSGTVTIADAAGGIATIAASGGSVAANDESYVHTSHAVFEFAGDKPILFEAAVQFSEANVDQANILVGLMDSVAAGMLADDNAGPKASYSGMVFFKAGEATSGAANRRSARRKRRPSPRLLPAAPPIKRSPANGSRSTRLKPKRRSSSTGCSWPGNSSRSPAAWRCNFASA